MKLKTADYKRDIFYLMNKYPDIVSKVETEMLLEYLFNCTRLNLYLKDFVVNETVEELYDSLINRRLGGEPVQYITGQAEFMGLDFIVTKDTFIPRPETELLVNEVINSFRLRPDSYRDEVENGRKIRILDLCTGSGNIAISIARSIPQAEIIATDVSDAALKIAEKNAARHDAGGRIKFYRGDLFNALIFDKNPKFDIMVCNPPYIKHADFPFLQDEVKMEPEISLNGGRDGLDFYRVIAKEAHRYLKSSGTILLEIGLGQKQDIERIFFLYNIFKGYRLIKDFNNIPRAMWFDLSHRIM